MEATSARDDWRAAGVGIETLNGPAVRVGRRHRDLLARPEPGIDRARRLVEQGVSASVDSRGAPGQQELIQPLADGGPALWGGSS